MVRDIATEARPLRISGLPSLARCPHAVALIELNLLSPSPSGKAADTGSLVHAAVEEFHKGGEKAALEVIANLKKFPAADPDEARLHFAGYAADARNQGVRLAYSEVRVAATVTGDGFDPVFLTGTLDQIRDENGILYLYDVKTGGTRGNRSAADMVLEYTLQMAGYLVAANQTLGKRIEMGGLICTDEYRKRETAARHPFVRMGWSLGAATEMLRRLALTVQAVRDGRHGINPGGHCHYCPAIGPGNCTKLLNPNLKG